MIKGAAHAVSGSRRRCPAYFVRGCLRSVCRRAGFGPLAWVLGRGLSLFGRGLDHMKAREGRRLDHLDARVPWAGRVDFAVVARARGIVIVLIHEARRRRDFADLEGRLAQTVEGLHEGAQMRDLAGHQELQRLLGARDRRKS